MPAAAREARAVLTRRAGEALDRIGARCLLIKLEYSRGPCADDWCPPVPRAIVEPAGGPPADPYVRLDDAARVYAAPAIERALRARGGGGTLIVDFRRGKFVVRGLNP